MVSGYASDVSSGIADLITRTFGGIDIGFVLLGRVSIGDNDTLAKILQTIVDTTIERATEMSVATYFYDKVKTKQVRRPGIAAVPKRSAAEIFGFED